METRNYLKQKALLWLTLASVWNPLGSFANEQTGGCQVSDRVVCQEECSSNPCVPASVCTATNAAVAVGAIVLGGVAGAITGRKKGHSHCSSSRISQSDIDQGQSLTINTLTTIVDLENGGTVNVSLFAIDPQGREYRSDVYTFTGTVLPTDIFPIVERTLTIQNPLFGDWLIGVTLDLVGGNVNSQVEFTPVYFLVTRSSDGTTVESVEATPIYLDSAADHQQKTFGYGYLKP